MRFAGGPTSRPSFFISRNLLALTLGIAAARSARAEDAPKVVLERIMDGRGNPVCDVARASGRTGTGGTRSVQVVRGLVRSDLVFRRTVEFGADAKGVTVDEIGLEDRLALRFSSAAPGGRVTATSPASSFRYFDQDVSRKTVRCNLSRLVEESDRDLLAAAAEWSLLKQGLGGDPAGPEDAVVLTLCAIEKRPPHPSPPARRRRPLSESEPGAVALAAAARAAFDR